MVRTNRGSFLRGFLERFLDNEYAHNRLTQPQYLKLQASLSSTLVNRLETCLLLRTPFIFCEYIGRSPRGVDTGGMPADLRGLLRVQYHSYQDMCEQLYFGLPDFFDKEGFR